MKKTISTLLVTVSLFAGPLLAIAQTSPQKDKIPATMSPDVRKELEAVLSSELQKRLEGAYNLGTMGEKAAEAIPFLIDILQQDDGMTDVDQDSLKFFEKDAVFLVYNGKAATINPVQMVVSDALVKIGKQAIEPLRAMLPKADPTELPFAYAAGILARMQDPATTKMLHGMLSDDNRHVRSRVVEALARSKDPATVDALIGALKDQDASVKSAAARSLKKITGQDLGEDARKWEDWRAKDKTIIKK
jgi:HEAT repeat protein